MSFDREAIEQKSKHRSSDGDVFDFGFSFADTDEVAQESSLVQSNTDLMQSIEKIILPLLVNLKKDPERDYILWKGMIVSHNATLQSNVY